VRLWPEQAESGVLVAVLVASAVNPDAGHRLLRRARATGLQAQHFGSTAHAALYAAMCSLADDGLPISTHALADELRDPHAAARLDGLAAALAPITNIGDYANAIRRTAP
jgi:replicative DNA helicase